MRNPKSDKMDAQQRKWILDTVSTVNDWSRNMKQFDQKTQDEYDKRIQDDIQDFVKFQEFYSMPLQIIFRNIEKTRYIYSVDDAMRALTSCLNYHGEAGLSILSYLKLDDNSGRAAFEVAKSLTASPLFSQLIQHPFQAPPKEKSKEELELEAIQVKRKDLLSKTNQKMIETGKRVDELKTKIQKGEEYKKRCHNWPEERKKYETAIEVTLEENEELKQENTKWKNAAFRKFDTAKRKEINQDICDACDKDDAESVIVLIEKDKSIVNKAFPHPINQNEEWTPLMHACYFGSYETVRVLLNNGANPNHRQWHGTAMDKAKEKNQTQIIQLLKEAGVQE